MILHKEDLEAIRDLIKEEVKILLDGKQLADTKPVKPTKTEEKK